MAGSKSSSPKNRAERKRATGQIIFSIIALVVILSFLIAAIKF